MTTRRNPPAKWVLPAEVNPRKRLCFQIEVPDDQAHIAAFRGALYNLTSARFWQDDVAHTAKDVAKVWQSIYDNIRICDDCTASGFAGAEGDPDYMLRQNPDNPCLLETSVDGVTWCAWADLSKCVQGSQPGDGATQPKPGGGTACYSGKLQANGIFLVPVLVNTGDVLTVGSIKGAGTDGTVHWYCPDGNIFFAGACGGGAAVSGSDPLPSVAHMKIIAKIASTYYDLTGGAITVGAGVVNEQVFIQVNDDNLADNSGEYTLEEICVTNNQTARWTHRLDFRVSNWGFSPCHRVSLTTPLATWVAGVGWQSTFGADGFNFNLLYIFRDSLPTTGYDQITDIYSSAQNMQGHIAGPGNATALTANFGAIVPNTSGTLVTASQAIAAYNATSLRIDLEETVSGASNLITLQEITLSGPGVDPF